MEVSARIREKGKVTIPAEIRRKLNLRKGDVIEFVETDSGVFIKPVKVALTEALDELGNALKAEGVTLEQWIERGREIRGKLVEEMYGLKDNETP